MVRLPIYVVYTTEEYDEWVASESLVSQRIVAERLQKITWDGHFGDVKPIGDGVSEMRWANGRRVYYVLVPERNMLLLLGGYKNGQKKDIKRAKKICEKYSCRVED